MTNLHKGDAVTVKEHTCLGMAIGPFQATVRELYFGFAVVVDENEDEWCVRWQYLEKENDYAIQS